MVSPVKSTKGGYGRVYKCTLEGKTTAVKILDDLTPEAQKRFKSEIEILRRVDHENVVKVYDAGETDGHYWYELEYAEYGHFGQMYGFLPYNDLDRVNYFCQICRGVQALHDLDPPIIHGDLKPSNILVFKDSGRKIILKIADLGEAGSEAYIAPERLQNAQIKTYASDIYSLGITFLEACSGHICPSNENLKSVPNILRPIIEKMVQRYDRDRYQSISEVGEAFDSLPSWQLFTGREPSGYDNPAPILQIKIVHELENVLDSLRTCNRCNVLDRLEELERTLARLGEARDYESHTLMIVSRNAMKLIEDINPDTLLRRLVGRFIKATDATEEGNFSYIEPHSWSRFLADTFALSSHRPTKHLCLEGLVKFLGRFGSLETKDHLYQTIIKIDDPDYMRFLAEQLRGRGREDVAVVLDDVLDPRVLDLELLESALRSAS